jgi:hypothetical protein
MYRRPKFLEVLLEIRQTMSREADYDIDLFAEMIRSGKFKGEFNGASGQPKIELPASGDRPQIADY